jgi:pectin lyase
MKLSILATAFAVWTSNVAAIAVTGAAEGFAKGVTGGGNAAPVYPSN